MLPELSIIVPILNEAGQLEPFLCMLARQERVCFELLFSDGGSTDTTLAELTVLANEFPFDVKLVTGDRGRGKQLNKGAAAARGPWLLFLHVDSQFSDTMALCKGLSILKDAADTTGNYWTAGRFTLRFDHVGEESRYGLTFCEGKASLGRDGCILGDQGFMLSRRLLERVGPFNESLPVGEDIEFAQRIRRITQFQLLPVTIYTSSRRFRSEGYRPRQTLNALLMGLLHCEYTDFLTLIPGSYRSHHDSHRLELRPFFSDISILVATLPMKQRLQFWYQIGAYVRSNAWQLAYALDVRRMLRRQNEIIETTALTYYDRYLDRITDHPPGRLFTALLVWLWFILALKWRWLREGKKGEP